MTKVHTRLIDDDRALMDFLPGRHDTVSWVRDGEGIVGWGVAACVRPSGAQRFGTARQWWAQTVAGWDIQDDVELPGTGAVAFASFAFADSPGDSVLIVPRVLVGRRGDTTWLTTVGDVAERAVEALVAPREVRYSRGQLDADGYRDAVSLAVQRIRAGALDKVVLAHDLIAESAEPFDERYLLTELTRRYPRCWTYAVDHLVGATPEMLLLRKGNTVSARLLAGTAWPHDGVDDFDELAQELLSSRKNKGEHAYGVRSLVDALTPFCTDLDVPEPQVLRLPNVLHLSTTVSGTLREEASLLELTERVHPTAAVGGTPTDAAVATIAEIEQMDRGRYAGPIGWIDADGDGEFGIALRGAQLDGTRARIIAGGGIVADSVAAQEVEEVVAKMRVMRSVIDGA